MTSQDEDYLRLLATFHYVLAGIAALFALFPIFHLLFGLIFILAPHTLAGNGQQPPAIVGWFLVVFAATIITLGWVYAGFILVAGRFLAKHRHYMFCLVMGGVECIFMPFGTVLGVFTIVILMRDPVKRLFFLGDPTPAAGTVPPPM